MADSDADPTPPTKEETLAVFTQAEPLTTEEVAAELDVPKRMAYRRLSELAEEGYFERRERKESVMWEMIE